MIRFGTGGWRGIIADDFTFENVRIFAQVIADDVSSRDEKHLGVIIGYDNRFMSNYFAQAASEVFAANDILVHMFDTSVPTPMVNFALKELGASCSLTFTASHNPAIYNGIKFTCKGGIPASPSITESLEKRMNNLSPSKVKSIPWDMAMEMGKIQIFNYQNDYINYIESHLDMDTIKQSRLRVLYDPMYGTGITSVGTLLVDARCSLEIIHNQRNPLFGGRVPAPNKETLWKIRYMMKENGYDVAFATDGDADRLAIIDDKANYLHPNEILALLYHYLLDDKKQEGGVVRNLCTTHLVDKIAKDYGYNVYETPVGFRHIANSLVKTDAIIGGESSGGMALKGHLLEKDGILATGLVLEMMAKRKEKLSVMIQKLKQKYGTLHFIEKNYRFLPEQRQHISEMISHFNRDIMAKPLLSVSKLDGTKYILEDGTWASIRFSGTEPLLRIMIESEDETFAINLLQRITGHISKKFKLH